MRDKLLKALRSHAHGHIQKPVGNVEGYLNHPAGIGEHPDIIEAKEKELNEIATYHDQIEVLDKYFKE